MLNVTYETLIKDMSINDLETYRNELLEYLKTCTGASEYSRVQREVVNVEVEISWKSYQP